MCIIVHGILQPYTAHPAVGADRCFVRWRMIAVLYVPTHYAKIGPGRIDLRGAVVMVDPIVMFILVQKVFK